MDRKPKSAFLKKLYFTQRSHPSPLHVFPTHFFLVCPARPMGILIPGPGINPVPSAVGAQGLSYQESVPTLISVIGTLSLGFFISITYIVCSGCPIALATMLEIFYTCPVQYSSYYRWSFSTQMCLVGLKRWHLLFWFTLINISLKSGTWLVALVLKPQL